MSDVLRSHATVVDTLTVASGGTLNVSGNERNLIQTTIKYASGGTLYVMGTTNQPAGTTLGWLMSSTEVHHHMGPDSFYLAALGATTLVYRMRVYGEGYLEGTFS